MSTYNGAKYLQEQMDSIVHQTVAQDLHVYVRDDGSTDNTIELLKTYKDKVQMTIVSGKNLGPPKSFWELFTDPNIRADYYAFCDQDDIWDLDKIEKGIKAIKEKKGPMLWCSNCRVIDSDNLIKKEKYHESDPVFTLASQIVCGTIQGCAMLLNNKLRSMIIEKQLESIPMHDFAVLTHAIHLNCIEYDSLPSVSYRIHEKNYYGSEDGITISHIRKTLHRWFASEQKNLFLGYIESFLINNDDGYVEKEKRFLEDIVQSKKSVFKRIDVIKNPLCIVPNHRAVRSFRIRILLGIY